VANLADNPEKNSEAVSGNRRNSRFWKHHPVNNSKNQPLFAVNNSENSKFSVQDLPTEASLFLASMTSLPQYDVNMAISG